MYRVTKLLRDAGYAGLSFPFGAYQFNGTEQFGDSALPGVGFTIRFENGALMKAEATPALTNSIPFALYARGGDTGTAGEIYAVGYGARYWTQVIQGSETSYAGVADIVGLAVGDTIICRFGADNTDGGGVWKTSTMAKILSITPTGGTTGTVVVDTPSPSPLPLAPGNALRQYDKHDMLKVTGFQDNSQIRGGRVENIFFTPLFSRNCVIDVDEWTECRNFAIITGPGSGMIVPKMIVRRVLGSAVTHANVITLTQHQNAHFGSIIIESIKPIGPAVMNVFSEEASCVGTRIEAISVNFNAIDAFGGNVGIFGQTPGQTDLVSVGRVTLLGGYGTCSFDANYRIDVLEARTGPYINLFVRGDQVRSMYWRDQVWNYARDFNALLPAPASTTQSMTVPWHGITRYLRVRPVSMVGVTAVNISGDGFATTDYNITANMTLGVWTDIPQAALMSVATGNFLGNNALTIRVTTDGSSPIGNAIAIAASTLLVDLNLNDGLGSFYGVDSSVPLSISSNGAPASSAAFVGQLCLDVVDNIWYSAISVGAGASDWFSPSTTAPVAAIAFTGSILGNSGAPAVSYMTGGPISSVSQLRFPTSARTITKMRVTKISSTISVSVVVTLFKNGSATTMTCTSLAADAAFTKYSDLANPISFTDAQDFDVQLSCATDASAGSGEFSVILE